MCVFIPIRGRRFVNRQKTQKDPIAFVIGTQKRARPLGNALQIILQTCRHVALHQDALAPLARTLSPSNTDIKKTCQIPWASTCSIWQRCQSHTVDGFQLIGERRKPGMGTQAAMRIGGVPRANASADSDRAAK